MAHLSFRSSSRVSHFRSYLLLPLLALACSDSTDRQAARSQPQSSCIRESGCVGCTTCLEVCRCAGQSEALCAQSCGPAGAGGSGGALGSGGTTAGGAGGAGGSAAGATGSGGVAGCSSWWPTPECLGAGSGGQLGAGGSSSGGIGGIAGSSSGGTGPTGGTAGGTSGGAAGFGGSTAGSAGQGGGGMAGTSSGGTGVGGRGGSGPSGGAAGFGGSTAGSAGASGAGGSCAGSVLQAEPLPTLLFFMFDASSRMSPNMASIRESFFAFLQSPQNAGLAVGSDSFPIGSECDSLDYPGPQGVPPSPLPGNAQALISALNAITPAGLAPIEAGLSGAIDLTYNYSDSNHSNAVVLVVGGNPTSCSTSGPVLAGIASGALAGPRALKTFVLVVGSASTPVLDAIAAAGGTQLAMGGITTTAQISAALQAVRAAAANVCNFPLPNPPVPVDPSRLNVRFTPQGGSAQVIPQVPFVDACSDRSAWYYDDAIEPSRITLCPVACSSVSADPNVQVDFLVGCPTVTIP